jgi:predicted porin
MKKSLIALAALSAFATAAQAQSNVTLYGAYGNGLTTTDTGTATSKSMAGNQVGTPVIGLRGTEDLGGGLQAFFNFEGTLGANGSLGSATTSTFTGTQATITGTGNTTDVNTTSTYTPAGTVVASPSNVFDRQAHVGLRSKTLGQLSLGRQNDSVKDTEGLTVFNNLSDAIQTTTVGDRYANAVKYVSPAFNGITVSYTYADNVTGSGSVTASGFNDATQNGGSKLNSYNVQGTYAGVKFAYANGEIVTDAGAKTETTRYGIQGKVMNATVGLSYTENEPSASDKSLDEITLAVSYPLGNGFTGMASYSDYSAKTISTGATNTALNGNGYALLLTKDLSKRTLVYAGYSLKDVDLVTETTTAGDVKVTAFGILHKF